MYALQKYAFPLASPPLVLFNLDHFRSYPCITLQYEFSRHALSRGGQDISLKVYRVFLETRPEERSEKFRRNKSSHGAIYLQTLPLPPLPPFFPPSPCYSFWNISQPSLSLSLSRPPQTLVSTPFFLFFLFLFLFVAIVSQWLIVQVLRQCAPCYKTVLVTQKGKTSSPNTRNTLVAVLKRVFPRFRLPSCIPVFRESLVVSRLISSSAGRHIHFILVGDTNVTTFRAARMYRSPLFELNGFGKRRILILLLICFISGWLFSFEF